MAMELYKHRCTIKSGNLAGNKRSQDVSSYDIRYRSQCDNCHELLAPVEEILAHIYGRLTLE